MKVVFELFRSYIVASISNVDCGFGAKNKLFLLMGGSHSVEILSNS